MDTSSEMCYFQCCIGSFIGYFSGLSRPSPICSKCEFTKVLHCSWLYKYVDCEKIYTKSYYHFSSCCHGKKIVFHQTRSYPLLEKMLKKNNASKYHYLENIRICDGVISFASFIANKTVRPNERGPYLFKTNSQAYLNLFHSIQKNTRGIHNFIQLI